MTPIQDVRPEGTGFPGEMPSFDVPGPGTEVVGADPLTMNIGPQAQGFNPETAFLGEDGQQRNFISDQGAKVRRRNLMGFFSPRNETEQMLAQRTGFMPRSLKSLIKHDKLFEAYPQLGEINVTLNENLGEKTLAGYDPESKTVHINSNRPDVLGNKDKLMTTILHEIQHTIQGLEGFSEGPKFGQEPSSEDIQTHKNDPAENEARMTERRFRAGL